LEAQKAIKQVANKLFPAIAMEQVWKEFNKMSTQAHFNKAVIDMHRFQLLEVIFPELKEVHNEDLCRWVDCYPRFPTKCPTILYLMELFPTYSCEERIDIVKRLKVPNKEIKILKFVDACKIVFEKERRNGCFDKYGWAQLMAYPEWNLGLQVLVARYPDEERTMFIQEYQMKYHQLVPHIQRIKERKPLISSNVLMEMGISPGQRMGMLLKEGERIAIEEDLHELTPILTKLMTLTIWK
jgi:poly(A) polymerase